MMVSAENDPRKAGTIWVLDLDEPVSIARPLIEATFCRVGAEYAPVLAEAMHANSPAEVLKRFESGRRCFTAQVDGKLAAYGWVSVEEEIIGELNLLVRLLPGETYIWDCATLPDFRQKHLYSGLLSYILGELRAESLCRVWIGADIENTASQRGMARAGFHHAANLVIERVFAMRMVWVQGQPGIPENVVEEARRAFIGNRDKVWLSVQSSALDG